jgi:hypothetical protein
MNFSELKKEVTKYTNTVKLHPDFLFRGQPDNSWKLTPSFTRIAKRNNLSRDEAIQLERESINKFSISANIVLPIERTIALAHSRLRSQDGHGIDFMGWLTVMQHFSAPTRLLDWTTSVWVALYFACAELSDCDGVIYIADFNKITKRFEENLNGANFNELMIDPSSIDIIAPIMTFNSNERIEAQQGRFLICTNPLKSHDDLLDESASLKKIVIPKEMKSDILINLNQMNINAKTLFPGIDGLGKSIYEYCHIWDKSSIIK